MSMISELVEELRLMAEMFANGEPYGNLLRRAANTIEMLSEKAREPKQGEWIKTSDEWIVGTGGVRYYPIHCSVCNYPTYDDSATNFCPDCGARMKGADNESRRD